MPNKNKSNSGDKLHHQSFNNNKIFVVCGLNIDSILRNLLELRDRHGSVKTFGQNSNLR